MPLRDIADEILQDVQAKFRTIWQSRLVQFILAQLQPLVNSTERFTGRGGILTNGFKYQDGAKKDDDNVDYKPVNKDNLNYDSGDDDESIMMTNLDLDPQIPHI